MFKNQKDFKNCRRFRSLFLFFLILILLSDCTETILNLRCPGNRYTGIIDILFVFPLKRTSGRVTKENPKVSLWIITDESRLEKAYLCRELTASEIQLVAFETTNRGRWSICTNRCHYFFVVFLFFVVKCARLITTKGGLCTY